MGLKWGKDIAEKILLAYNDVFSDIINVLLFGGQEIIRENDLEDQITGSAYKQMGSFMKLIGMWQRDGDRAIYGWHV